MLLCTFELVRPVLTVLVPLVLCGVDVLTPLLVLVRAPVVLVLVLMVSPLVRVLVTPPEEVSPLLGSIDVLPLLSL